MIASAAARGWALMAARRACAKIVIDASNPVLYRDGMLVWQDVPPGLTAAEHQRERLGDVRLVKTFSTVCASQLLELRSP